MPPVKPGNGPGFLPSSIETTAAEGGGRPVARNPLILEPGVRQALPGSLQRTQQCRRCCMPPLYNLSGARQAREKGAASSAAIVPGGRGRAHTHRHHVVYAAHEYTGTRPVERCSAPATLAEGRQREAVPLTFAPGLLFTGDDAAAAAAASYNRPSFGVFFFPLQPRLTTFSSGDILLSGDAYFIWG